jgi:fatty acid desaturase
MLFVPHLLPPENHLQESIFCTIIWILFSSFFCFIASIINHNHMHCRMFSIEAFNIAINFILSLARGHTATGIVVPHHLNHHVAAGSDADWIRPSLAGKGLGWVRLLRYVVRSSVTMLIQRTRPGAPVLSNRHRLSLRLERIFLFFTVLVAALHDGSIFFLFNVFPWLLGLSCLVGVNLLQHDGCRPTKPLGESRNFTGVVGNWIFFNNGFHTAHHWRPATHWSKLPELHAKLRKELPRTDLEYHSILDYLWRFGWTRRSTASNS